MMHALHTLLRSQLFAGTVAALSVAVLVGALLMQHFLYLTPCPLCILQRYCLIALTLFCGTSVVAGQRFERRLLALAGVVAVAGVSLAARQVYLQAMPSLSTGCGPGFEYIVNSFPLTEMLPMLFKGTGDCAQVDWIWHGITVPKLSLAAFAGFSLLLGWRMWPSKPSTRMFEH